MPDLLTHALVGYVLGTVAVARYVDAGGRYGSGGDRYDSNEDGADTDGGRARSAAPGYVTVAMAGALVPDLNHVSALVPARLFVRAGVPFTWNALQTGGGVLLVIALGTLLVAEEERRRVFACLSLGALSHLGLDVLIRAPDGRSQSVFWPVTRYQPPSGDLYASGAVWPLLVAAALALATWYVRRRDATPERAR